MLNKLYWKKIIFLFLRKKLVITKHKNNITKVIRVFETFAGIGAQHKAISKINKNSEIKFEIVKTSEWDARAIIAYAQIHNLEKFQEALEKTKKLEEEEINNFFKDKNFSLNSKKVGNILRKSLTFRRNLIASVKANNTLPDINNVNGYHLKNIDLLTYSFPCQGLSIANMGRGKGIKKGTDSTSNLIWEIQRILVDAKKKKVKLPKFLLMENVRNLLSKKHKNDYGKWKVFLEKLGYTTRTISLNGLDYGSVQKRERVFGISILDWKNAKNDKEFKDWFQNNHGYKLNLEERQFKYEEILKSSNDFIDEIKMSIPNKTRSRIKMTKENKNLLPNKWLKGKEWIFNTLTTKQDRHPNVGMIKLSKEFIKPRKLNHRFITPREAYMIMGFETEDFSKVKKKFNEGFITKESLYRQAGNSIVVPVLESIFVFLRNYQKEAYE